VLSKVFDGDRRVWRWSALAGTPLVALIVIWCLVPRPFYTGTDSVNAWTVSPPIASGQSACAGALNIPAGTARIQLVIVSGQPIRPELQMTLRVGGRSYVSSVESTPAPTGISRRVSFPVPPRIAGPVSMPASVCVRAVGGTFAVGGTPTTQSIQPPFQIGGKSTLLRLAVWYLPRIGSTRSYAGELETMFDRAAVLAPGFVAPWLFWVVFLVLLPVVALLAIRCLAIAAAGRDRCLVRWLILLAVLNGAAWSVITPAFQGPDEVDHFAYVQSIAERGEKPSPYPAATGERWSTAEQDALLGSGMLTDHLLNDSRAPGLRADESAYRQLVAATHPRANDGGGLQTTSSYGPLYYLAVAPGYLAASSGSPFSQLEAARLLSVIIGALACVFAFLTVRELAPRQVWLAVLAALLVAFEPMYAFLSGTVNNDIGIDAGAAAVAYLLVRLIRRGLERRMLVVLGLLLGVLPFVKASAYELYPLAALAIAGALWRSGALQRGRRSAAAVSLAILAACTAVAYELAGALDRALTPGAPYQRAARSIATASGSLSAALHHPFSYLTYLWEVFLPRLPGMSPHFPPGRPAETIFIRRGLAAFGWYDVLFPGWIYWVLTAAMIGALVLGILALWRERRFVARHWPEGALLALFPVVVVAAFEAIFFTMTDRPLIAEMGRYVFPALVPLAVLAVGALYGVGRRRVMAAGSVLLVVVLALSYASQLLTFTSFFS
jgi:4-amino-4-deoxy-L-arabinose transferase-like glycosyltransferase